MSTDTPATAATKSTPTYTPQQLFDQLHRVTKLITQVLAKFPAETMPRELKPYLLTTRSAVPPMTFHIPAGGLGIYLFSRRDQSKLVETELQDGQYVRDYARRGINLEPLLHLQQSQVTVEIRRIYWQLRNATREDQAQALEASISFLSRELERDQWKLNLKRSQLANLEATTAEGLTSLRQKQAELNKLKPKTAHPTI